MGKGKDWLQLWLRRRCGPAPGALYDLAIEALSAFTSAQAVVAHRSLRPALLPI